MYTFNPPREVRQGDESLVAINLTNSQRITSLGLKYSAEVFVQSLINQFKQVETYGYDYHRSHEALSIIS